MAEHAPHTSVKPAPLSQLSEEEELFRTAVREFAQNEIGPLVSQMDQEMRIATSLLNKLFELNLMGIEIPEQYGGTGSNLFMSVLAV